MVRCLPALFLLFRLRAYDGSDGDINIKSMLTLPAVEYAADKKET